MWNKARILLCASLVLSVLAAYPCTSDPPNYCDGFTPPSPPQWNSDYEVHASAQEPSQLTYWQEHVKELSPGNTSIVLNVTYAQLKGSVLPFKAVLPKGSCDVGASQTTSQTAQENNCTYATNGAWVGPAPPSSGACWGNFIVDSVIKNTSNLIQANFGITNESKPRFIVGYINPIDIKPLNLKYLIPGRMWLVRNGSNVFSNSYQEEAPFVDASTDKKQAQIERCNYVCGKLPRTAIGHDTEGNLWLVQIDGQENQSQPITGSTGMSLNDLAEFMIRKLRIWNAINLDGGGSSTTVLNGTVISTPHCHDSNEVCQRAVGSVMCVSFRN